MTLAERAAHAVRLLIRRMKWLWPALLLAVAGSQATFAQQATGPDILPRAHTFGFRDISVLAFPALARRHRLHWMTRRH